MAVTRIPTAEELGELERDLSGLTASRAMLMRLLEQNPPLGNNPYNIVRESEIYGDAETLFDDIEVLKSRGILEDGLEPSSSAERRGFDISVRDRETLDYLEYVAELAETEFETIAGDIPFLLDGGLETLEAASRGYTPRQIYDWTESVEGPEELEEKVLRLDERGLVDAEIRHPESYGPFLTTELDYRGLSRRGTAWVIATGEHLETVP